MQKIIIIAALLCVTAFATAGTAAAPIALAAGTGDGFLVTTGVVQKCHYSCKTCTGFTATTCASCTAPLVLQTDKSCGCNTGTEIQYATTGTMTCAAAATTGVSDLAKCQSGTHFWFETNKCSLCDAKCRKCTAGAAANCKQDGTGAAEKGCWGATTLGGDGPCGYTDAKAYIAYSEKEFDQTATTGASAAIGYRYDTTTNAFTYIACAVGCATCTATTGETCKTCATGFTVNTAKTACECAAGSYTDAATSTALDKCTACPTGCTTCTAAAVCTACDSSTHVMGTSTTDSSTCLSLSSTDTSTTSTTDGEKDGESTSTTATDATSTNGVLLTAASMLLAVILA